MAHFWITMCFIDIIDLHNHSSESFICFVKVETFLDYDKSSQGVVFTTDRAYEPGEQVHKLQDADKLTFLYQKCNSWEIL